MIFAVNNERERETARSNLCLSVPLVLGILFRAIALFNQNEITLCARNVTSVIKHFLVVFVILIANIYLRTSIVSRCVGSKPVFIYRVRFYSNIDNIITTDNNRRTWLKQTFIIDILLATFPRFTLHRYDTLQFAEY